MTIKISVPSKTFLLGEYVVLHAGPGILLATSPRFELVVNKTQQSVSGIHPDSPTAILLNDEAEFYQSYSLNFIDPYQGKGGFGASGAQFTMVSALKSYVEKRQFSEDQLLAQYQKIVSTNKNLSPSGADLIAHLHGGVCYFHKQQKLLQVFDWPFAELAYCLIHTGNKLATHLHLQELDQIDTTELEQLVFAGYQSLKAQQASPFLEAINSYAEVLTRMNLVAESTQQILNVMSANSDILAAKGCGALGVDVVLVLFKKESQLNTISWLKEKKFDVIAFGQDVEEGIRFEHLREGQS